MNREEGGRRKQTNKQKKHRNKDKEKLGGMETGTDSHLNIIIHNTHASNATKPNISIHHILMREHTPYLQATDNVKVIPGLSFECLYSSFLPLLGYKNVNSCYNLWIFSLRVGSRYGGSELSVFK